MRWNSMIRLVFIKSREIGRRGSRAKDRLLRVRLVYKPFPPPLSLSLSFLFLSLSFSALSLSLFDFFSLFLLSLLTCLY